MLISPGRIGRIGQPAGSTGRVSRLQSLLESLYGNGEQGAFFVPKPQVLGQQVLFQDAAGTTSVTSDGDPVGLMMDISKRLELGPELYPQAGFSGDLSPYRVTDLFQTSDPLEFYYQDGALVITPPAGQYSAIGLNSTIAIEPNTYVLIEFTYSCSSSVNLRVGTNVIGGTQYVDITGVFTAGTLVSRSARIMVGHKSTGFALVFRANSQLTLHSCSVKKIWGYHATQEVSGSRPVYRTDGQYHWLEFDGVDDALQTGDAFYIKNPLTLMTATDMPLGESPSTVSFLQIARNPTNGMRLGMRPSNAGWLRIYTRLSEKDVASSDGNSGNSDERLRVSTGIMTPGHILGRLNGSEVINGPQALTDESSDERHPLYVGGLILTSGVWHPFTFFGGLAITEPLTDPLLTAAERYLANLAGVTLSD